MFLSAFAMLASCGSEDDEPNNPDPVYPPQDETVEIAQKDLIGTWLFSAPDYANTDYIAFNGSGRGMLVLCGDLFRNTGYNAEIGGIVYFSYSIDGNTIDVMPERSSQIDDFTLTVNNLSSSTLDVTFNLDLVKPHKLMKHTSDDWEWFVNDGPASEDLTSSFVGNYVLENDRSHRLEVTKINNYTLKIKDLKKDTEKVGELIWHEIFNPEYNQHGAHLWDSNSNNATSYCFTPEGRLYTMAGKYYFDGYAVKIESMRTFKASDFFGIWLYWLKSGYYQFNPDGTATYYYLEKTGGDKLSGDSKSGKWKFDLETSTLSVYDFAFLPDRSWEIYDVSESGFITKEGEWLRVGSLPGVVGNCDDERIYGTWFAKSDGESFTVTFDDNGILQEDWTDGYSSDSSSMEYTFLKGQLDFPDLSPIFANSIGNLPFHVKFSSGSKPSKMTISDDSHSITFTRK